MRRSFMRSLLTALIATVVIFGTVATSAATTYVKPDAPAAKATGTNCVKPWIHNRYARYVLQFSHRGGDFHASTPTRAQLHKLGAMRSCWLHKGAKVPYVKTLHYWHHRSKLWHLHKYVDGITLYGGRYGQFVVPTYIVGRESHFHWWAKNPSSAAWGWYQEMPMHFRVGGTCYGLYRPAGDMLGMAYQHICAHKLKRAAGSSPWALTR